MTEFEKIRTQIRMVNGLLPAGLADPREMMRRLSDAKLVIEEDPQGLLDFIEIMQDGIRLTHFPTKGEKSQLEQLEKKTLVENLVESQARLEKMAAADERWQRYKMGEIGPHAAIVHGMGNVAAEGA